MVRFLFRSDNCLGWGDSGLDQGSTDKLQETIVPIVPSSNCMENASFSTQSLIVCAGGAGGGPCKVEKILVIMLWFLIHSTGLGCLRMMH